MDANNLMIKLNKLGLNTMEDFKVISEDYFIGKLDCSPDECRKLAIEIIKILKPYTKILVGGNNKYGKMGLGVEHINEKKKEYIEMDFSDNVIDVNY